jgi:hypothetical protein
MKEPRPFSESSQSTINQNNFDSLLVGFSLRLTPTHRYWLISRRIPHYATTNAPAKEA